MFCPFIYSAKDVFFKNCKNQWLLRGYRTSQPQFDSIFVKFVILTTYLFSLFFAKCY